MAVYNNCYFIVQQISKELKIIFTVCYALLLVMGWYIVVDYSPLPVSAGITGNDLKGWAWSETIGWISFNSANCDLNGNNIADDLGAPSGCPTSGPIPNYGITVDGSGFLSGHAWSEHIGWISFESGDVSGCPPGGGCLPRRVVNRLRGWARATSVSPSQGGNPSEGWDGWISLTRVNCDIDEDGFSNGGAGCPAAGVAIPDYAVRVSTCDYDNYAWGSTVLGWISFNSTNCDADGVGGSDGTPGCPALGTPIASYKVVGTGNACGPAPLVISCTHAPQSAIPPDTQKAGSLVTWTVTVTGGSGIFEVDWSGTPGSNYLNTIPSSPPQVSVTQSYDTVGTKTGSVTVTDSLTSEVQSSSCGSIDITGGILSLVAVPTRVVRGDTSDVTWTTEGFADGECILSSSPRDGSAPPLPRPQLQDGTYTTPPLQEAIRYTLTCTGTYFDSQFVDVSVTQPPDFQEIPPQ